MYPAYRADSVCPARARRPRRGEGHGHLQHCGDVHYFFRWKSKSYRKILRQNRHDLRHVDGAEWTDYKSGQDNSTSHEFQLSSTGSYRAVYTYDLYGTGTTDHIERTAEASY